ncbi:MAG TPA: hypothetical protein VF552_13100 [Allosphingosinicella sp.]
MSNNAAGSSAGGTPTTGGAGSQTPAAPVQTATLTGLYESGTAPRRSQMCVVESGGRARFGLVAWTGPDESCSGNGVAVRSGDALRLTMQGDEACTFEARIEGTRVVFPAALPAGCAYYCSRGGRLAGAAFDKTGGTEADAARAQDLIGDPLCGG